MPEPPAAELCAATKRYGDVTALDSVSFALERGRVTALLGPNGAGKTTAVKLLLGLARPTKGSARLFGGEPRDVAVRRRTGVMLQIARVPDTLKVREHLQLFCSYYPSPMTIDQALATAGLSGVAGRKYGDLSGGQRQRVQFALAICGNPDVLFLDEPTVGLDVESRRGFWQEVRRLASSGRTIVLTTHYLEEADALADRIIVLSTGRIVADAPPHAIKARAGGRRVRCLTALDDDTLAQLPGVRSVRRDGTAVELLTGDAESLARALLARDPSLAGLEITGAGLEEAFMALTSSAGAIAARAAHDTIGA
jgi:ABC-2 type transport system ATP-binding protein